MLGQSFPGFGPCEDGFWAGGRVGRALTRAAELLQDSSMPVVRLIFLMLALGWTGWSASIPDFIQTARDRHGAAGEGAARFLVEHMTEADRRDLSNEFLL